MVNLQELWEKWKLEVLVLGSLTLQVILFLFGSSRKRSSGKLIISLLWVTYLSADWVATFALGTISSTLSYSSPSYARIDIMALWAPFLLLHLGGPDKITAFSLEDNQLWLRHAMILLVQTIAAVHIFITSMPRAKLISPAAFICLAGILKYGERTWALKKGSLKGLRGMGIIPFGDMKQWRQFEVMFQPDLTETPLEDPCFGEQREDLDGCQNNHGYNQLKLLILAYELFQFFGGYFLDLILSHGIYMSLIQEELPIKRNPYDFFQILEIELSFAYDILYTKALVVHSLSGRLLRAACFCSEFIAFFLFLATEKKDYQKADVAITYILLTGALALEIVALASLIFSDWTIAQLELPEDLERDGLSRSVRLKLCFYRVLSRSRCIPLLCQKHHRWSNRIGQYSLLGYCFKNRRPIACFDKLLTSFGMKEMWNEVRYTEFVQIKDGLKEFIFNCLKDEANLIGTSSELRQAYVRNRGRRTLKRRNCSKLSWSTGGAFDESVVVWHIATNFCLIRLGDKSNGRSEGASDDEKHHCEWAKNLSRYLLYLLLVHPLAMSSTSGLAAYEDICQDAMRYLKQQYSGDESDAVLSLMSSDLTSYIWDERGEAIHVWAEAAKLAEELLKLPEREMRMWTIVSEVLLEMLCFAARRCKGNYHAQMLSYGGELLTFIWFLEAHLGLVESSAQPDATRPPSLSSRFVEDNVLRTNSTHEYRENRRPADLL